MDSQTDKIEIALNLVNKTSLIVKRLDSTLGSIHGIGLTEYLVLNALSSIPTQSLRRIDIAESLGKTASGITRVLLPMEKTGLIIKETKERDGRVSLVKITDAGTTTFQDANTTMQQQCIQIFGNWNDKENKLMINLLNKI